MKTISRAIRNGFTILALLLSIQLHGQYQREDISRGMVAVKKATDQVYTAWRLLITDEDTLAFNVYRITDGAAAIKVNPDTLRNGTNYLDTSVNTSLTNSYYVTALKSGGEEVVSDTVNVWNQNYLNITIQQPDGDTTPPYTVTNNNVTESYPNGQPYTYTANDCSIGDLNSDGEYEIVLKWDPTNSRDNAYGGITGNVYLDGYEIDGTFLWRIDLGINIRAGAHYTQFMVYDLDGDGKAEVACKTAPGTKDGSGNYLSSGPAASDNDATDYRSSSGYILTGPEYLTIFDGETGIELITTNYNPPRGTVSSWGDSYGNRVDRFLACIAYVDGQKPSLVMCRGYYTGSGRGRTVLAAWDYRGDSLHNRWTFNADLVGENPTYPGQGNHNLSVGDVDEDGKDEIIYGACAIDDDGTGLYTTGWGHGDAMHLSDLDPLRPGLEVFQPHENHPIDAGIEFRDARTGEFIWGVPNTDDVGRGIAADIDPRYIGCEAWAAGGGLSGNLYSCKGELIKSGGTGPVNFGIWWDGDLCRELLDDITISKWNYLSGSTSTIFTGSGCASNNSTKKTPALTADLFGDWREEVILRTSDNSALRIFTTTIATQYRINCLMQDHIYRMGVAWQNVAYNQPPHTGFYLGTEMFTPDSLLPPNTPMHLTAIGKNKVVELNWSTNVEPDLAGYNVYRSKEATGSFDLINVSVADTNFYADTTVINDTLYYYKITAIDSFDNESDFSSVVSAIPTIRPDVPSGFFVRNGQYKVKAFWNQHQDENVVGYNVYRSTVSGSGYTIVNPTIITDTVYLDSALTNGATYYYVITCVNSDDKESFYTEEKSIVPGPNTYIQGEEGIPYNVLFESNNIGFNGTAFVNFFNPSYVEFPYINGNNGGEHILTYRYALGNNDRTGLLVINGESQNLTMHNTGAWTTYVYDSVNISLNADITNTLRFAATTNDFGNLDEIIVKPVSFVSVYNTMAVNNGQLRIVPNPFRYQTDISFMIEKDSEISVNIYNYLGQEVTQLFDGKCIKGFQQFTWNGQDAMGQKVSKGIYFVRVTVNNHEQWVGKIISIE